MFGMEGSQYVWAYQETRHININIGEHQRGGKLENYILISIFTQLLSDIPTYCSATSVCKRAIITTDSRVIKFKWNHLVWRTIVSSYVSKSSGLIYWRLHPNCMMPGTIAELRMTNINIGVSMKFKVVNEWLYHQVTIYSTCNFSV